MTTLFMSHLLINDKFFLIQPPILPLVSAFQCIKTNKAKMH